MTQVFALVRLGSGGGGWKDLFPNVTKAMKHKGLEDVEEFRWACLYETGLSFCIHFGLPAKRNSTCDSPIPASMCWKLKKAWINYPRS